MGLSNYKAFITVSKHQLKQDMSYCQTTKRYAQKKVRVNFYGGIKHNILQTPSKLAS